MNLGLHWQEKAKSDSVFDGDIQKIINDIPDRRAQNICGKVFPDATRSLVPFADADRRIVYIPNWVKDYFEIYEFQWIVFHEMRARPRARLSRSREQEARLVGL